MTQPTRRGFLKGLLASIGAVAAAPLVKADDPVIEVKATEPQFSPAAIEQIRRDPGLVYGTMTAYPRNVTGSLTAYWTQD